MIDLPTEFLHSELLILHEDKPFKYWVILNYNDKNYSFHHKIGIKIREMFAENVKATYTRRYSVDEILEKVPEFSEIIVELLIRSVNIDDLTIQVANYKSNIHIE